jgi:hypothetical protein
MHQFGLLKLTPFLQKMLKRSNAFSKKLFFSEKTTFFQYLFLMESLPLSREKHFRNAE